MLILDTDTIIYLFNNNIKIVEALSTTKEAVVTTTINQAELFFGAHRSQRQAENLHRLQQFFTDIPVLSFDATAAQIFGENKSLLMQIGKPIDDCDLMIASIALAHEATLVTNNTRHFNRVKNLHLVNWLH